MNTKDDKPVEFSDDDQPEILEDNSGQTAPPIDEDRYKTAAMESMDERAILDEESFEEKTQLISNPFERPARLIVVFGPDQGKEFPLLYDENTVGRALDCNVVLNDPTVSKRHCIVSRKNDKFLIKDLGSGNGTKLNGEKISESQLIEGTRIELGRTVMTFSTSRLGMPKNRKTSKSVSNSDHQARTLATEIPKASKPVQAEPKVVASSPWGRIVGLSLLVVLLTGGVIATLQWGFDVNILGVKKAQPVVAAVPSHKKAVKLYNKGLKFMGDENWDQAISGFQKALDLEPELRRASRRIVIAQEEKHALEIIKKADKMTKQNNISEVKELLKSVPQDSVYFTRARSKLLKLKERQAAIEVAQVKSMVDAGNITDGKKMFLKLLGKYPGNTAVLELGKLFEQKDIKPKTVKNIKRRIRSHHRSRTGINMNTIFSMYAGGAFSDAVDELRGYVQKTRNSREKRKKTRLADSIQSFAAMYKAGKDAVASGDYTTAIKNIRGAQRLDREISGKYQTELKTLLAKAYRGRAAKYVMKRQYVQAVRDARAALRLNHGDNTSLMVLNKCNQVAKKYYDSAMSDLKSGNTASAKIKFENVMKLVTRDSDLYKQASTRYQQIR